MEELKQAMAEYHQALRDLRDALIVIQKNQEEVIKKLENNMLTKENLKTKAKILKELEKQWQPFNKAHYKLESWGYDIDVSLSDYPQDGVNNK